MTSAYPKVLQLGDRNVADIFEGIVEISEKVDGSQIGWGLVPSYYSHAGGISTRDLQLVIRSHHREFYRDNSTVYLAGPLDCGGIREVDVHGSKGPL